MSARTGRLFLAASLALAPACSWPRTGPCRAAAATAAGSRGGGSDAGARHPSADSSSSGSSSSSAARLERLELDSGHGTSTAERRHPRAGTGSG